MNLKNIINLSLLTLLIILAAVSGCAKYALPVKLQPLVPPDNQQDESMEKRFDESDLKRPTAVESAIELSEKYATLSEQTADLKQQNQLLDKESQNLKDQLNQSRAQLTQTQKELEEANDLLIEMRIELNNWKTDIIGFRQEMREADKAQLETLFKVLKVLGGEIKNDLHKTEDANFVTVSQDDTTQPTTQTQ